MQIHITIDLTGESLETQEARQTTSCYVKGMSGYRRLMTSFA